VLNIRPGCWLRASVSIWIYGACRVGARIAWTSLAAIRQQLRLLPAHKDERASPQATMIPLLAFDTEKSQQHQFVYQPVSFTTPAHPRNQSIPVMWRRAASCTGSSARPELYAQARESPHDFYDASHTSLSLSGRLRCHSRSRRAGQVHPYGQVFGRPPSRCRLLDIRTTCFARLRDRC